MPIDFVDDFLESGTIMSMGKSSLLIGWGKRKWSQAPQNEQNINFYFPDFFLARNPSWFTHEHYQEISIASLKQALGKTNQDKPKSLHWDCCYKEIFYKAFKDLKEKFKRNEIAKAVPYVFEKSNGTMDTKQLRTSLSSLLNYAHAQPAVHAYGFWENGHGMLGATPELLFSLGEKKPHTLITMACAGTKDLRGQQGSFMSDPKEVHEHQLVVEGIIESLAPYGKVTIGSMRVLDLPKLSHLLTPIELDLSHDADYFDFVKALHPTPALGAFPRKEGFEWLRSYQDLIDRKRYGAPIGYKRRNTNDAACYVAIRNAQWDPNEIYIGAGCGIVSESLLEREWEEIKLKIQAIKEMLAL